MAVEVAVGLEAEVEVLVRCVFRTYRGVKGQQRALCHGAIKAHVECSHRFPSFVHFDWV